MISEGGMDAEHNTQPPAGLLARIGERPFTILGAVWFALVTAYRLTTHAQYASLALFALETAVPATLFAAYLTRERAVVRARGFEATVLPLIGAVLPFAFLEPPFAGRIDVFVALLIPPTTGMVLGYLFLNRSFAIMAEARSLKTGGPYRFVRHPVYACQILCSCIVVLFRPSLLSGVLLAAFIAIQVRRSRVEDRALAEAHGQEFEAYRARVRAFRPF